jgi:hypothetical protein
MVYFGSGSIRISLFLRNKTGSDPRIDIARDYIFPTRAILPIDAIGRPERGTDGPAVPRVVPYGILQLLALSILWCAPNNTQQYVQANFFPPSTKYTMFYYRTLNVYVW